MLFLFWTFIAEHVINSISVLARTCPRLAGEDWPHRREYCWRHNHAVTHSYAVGTKKNTYARFLEPYAFIPMI
jgi:hypothetical protein